MKTVQCHDELNDATIILYICLHIIQRMTVGYYENERKGSVFTATTVGKYWKLARKACCVVKEMLFFKLHLHVLYKYNFNNNILSYYSELKLFTY